MAETTGLAELLAELVGRFGQALFSTDSAIILGRTVNGTVHSWANIADIYTTLLHSYYTLVLSGISLSKLSTVKNDKRFR